jgi:hypothetical protein
MIVKCIRHIKYCLTCFALALFFLPFLFNIRMIFFAKLDLNGFLCGTYSCYVKFVTYHAIPILIEWNGMPCPMHVNRRSSPNLYGFFVHTFGCSFVMSVNT